MTTHQSVYGTDDLSDQVGNVANQAEEERVQIQGIEYTLDDLDQVAQSDHKLKVDIDVSNGDVHLLDGNHNSGIDLDQASNLGVQVEIGLQLLHNQLNASNMELGNLEEDIGNGGSLGNTGRGCGGRRSGVAGGSRTTSRLASSTTRRAGGRGTCDGRRID